MENKNEKFKIWWDKEEKILRTKIIGKLDTEDAKLLVKELSGVMEEAKQKGARHMDSINDATEAGLNTDPEFRKIFADFFKKEELSDTRVAMFGLGAPQKVVVNFLAGVAGFKTVKFFTTEEEALIWSREARKKRDKEEASNF